MVALGLVGTLVAAGQAPATVVAPAPAAVTTATLRGHIADQTGALIPGAAVTLVNSAGKNVATSTADTSGVYQMNGLAPGAYMVRATYAGFAPFQSPAITLTAGQVKRVDIVMAIEVAQQSVVVTDESPTVSVEAGGNANTIIIKGKDLDALSDDPD